MALWYDYKPGITILSLSFEVYVYRQILPWSSVAGIYEMVAE